MAATPEIMPTGRSRWVMNCRLPSRAVDAVSPAGKAAPGDPVERTIPSIRAPVTTYTPHIVMRASARIQIPRPLTRSPR